MGHFPKVHGLNAFTWISAKIRIKGLESGNARRWKFETLIPRRIWFHRNSIPLDGIRGKSYYNLGDFFDFVTECPNIFWRCMNNENFEMMKKKKIAGIKNVTHSLASCLVTSSIRRAAIVTFLVAFFGKGFIPGRPEKIHWMDVNCLGELLLFRTVRRFISFSWPHHPPLSWADIIFSLFGISYPPSQTPKVARGKAFNLHLITRTAVVQ